MDEVTRISAYLLSISGEISRMVREGFWDVAMSERTAGRQDMATNLDHKIGQFVSARLMEQFDGLIRFDSEEAEERRGDGPYVVRIDPLDGTKHAISGIALVTSLISVSVDERTVFALMIHPFTDKVYSATIGKGAYVNGHQIHVSDQSIYDNFVIHEQPTSSLFQKNPSLFAHNEAHLHALMTRAYRLRNVGNASISVGWVAEGAATAYVDLSGTTKLYDIEAAILIAREAGAVVGDFEGNSIEKVNYATDDDRKVVSEHLLIANPKAYAEIVTLFEENRE